MFINILCTFMFSVRGMLRICRYGSRAFRSEAREILKAVEAEASKENILEIEQVLIVSFI